MTLADATPLWPAEMTAWGTLTLAVAAVAVALFAEWRSSVRVKQERERSYRLLAEERAAADKRLADQMAHNEQQRRQEEHAQFKRLITEAISAAEDMSAALSRFAKFAGMTMVADAAKNAEFVYAPPAWMNDESVPAHRRLLRGLFFIIGMNFSEKPTDTRYLQLIFPAMQRLRAALMPLRVGSDPAIAESANRLAVAAEFVSVSTERKNKQEWENALVDFRATALDRFPVGSGLLEND
jgi:hypothetical protein